MQKLNLNPNNNTDVYVDAFIDFLSGITLEVEAAYKDNSFDHEFGIEESIDFVTEGVKKVFLIEQEKTATGFINKGRKDISNMTIRELFDNMVREDDIQEALDAYEPY